jgi:hypothetical protein
MDWGRSGALPPPGGGPAGGGPRGGGPLSATEHHKHAHCTGTFINSCRRWSGSNYQVVVWLHEGCDVGVDVPGMGLLGAMGGGPRGGAPGGPARAYITPCIRLELCIGITRRMSIGIRTTHGAAWRRAPWRRASRRSCFSTYMIVAHDLDPETN